MASTDRRLLSICVPTHTGRRDQVAYLLRSTLAQLHGGLEERVELCVSDNATRDGTNELLRDLAAQHPGVLTHRRQQTAVSASSNVLAAVDLARAEYCWMISSDDAPAPGAVRKLVELLEVRRPRGGVTVDWTIWNRSMDRRLRVQLDAVKPAPVDHERRYEQFEAILADLGALFSYMSIHIFSVDAWRQARGQAGDAWLRFSPLFAHVLGLGAIARATEDWIWIPLPLLEGRRNEDDGDAGRAAAHLTRDISRVWSRLVGRRSDAYRVLLRRWYHLYATRGHVLYYKQQSRHGCWGDVRLVVALGRTLGPDAEFRRRSLPVLLVPGALVRASPATRARLGAWRESELNVFVEERSAADRG